MHPYEMASTLRERLEWTRRLIADIRSGSLDGLELWRNFHRREPR